MGSYLQERVPPMEEGKRGIIGFVHVTAFAEHHALRVRLQLQINGRDTFFIEERSLTWDAVFKEADRYAGV